MRTPPVRKILLIKIKCTGYKKHKPHFFMHFMNASHFNMKQFCDEALRIKMLERGRKRYANSH